MTVGVGSSEIDPPHATGSPTWHCITDCRKRSEERREGVARGFLASRRWRISGLLGRHFANVANMAGVATGERMIEEMDVHYDREKVQERRRRHAGRFVFWWCFQS